MNGIRSGIFSSVPSARLQDIVLDNARIQIGINAIVSRASTSKLLLARLPLRFHILHAETHLQVQPHRDTSDKACFSWPRLKKLKLNPTKSSYLNCG
jgi:hypothetical protein